MSENILSSLKILASKHSDNIRPKNQVFDLANYEPNDQYENLPTLLHGKHPDGILQAHNAYESEDFETFLGFETTDVFNTYWRFAAERQEVFFSRLANDKEPWSEDPILQQYRFTNAYRASDRVSQYLIRNVQYTGDQTTEELFFRTMMFKIFNRVSTWELLEKNLGEIAWTTYSFPRYDEVLSQAMASKEKIFSAAYIMPSGGPNSPHSRKHRNYLILLEQMMMDGLPEKIKRASTMEKAFHLIRNYPMMGDFLAYQYVTDLNYSVLTDFSEMEFVIAGPGARDGLVKCFPTANLKASHNLIQHVAERQEEEFSRLGLTFRTLWGRPLQLIDCQNLFCEVSKYTRVSHPHITGIAGRTRIKQVYRKGGSVDAPFYPPKWGINHLIERK